MTTSDLALGNHPAQNGAPLLRATCTPKATYFVGVTKGGSPRVSGDPTGVLTVGVGTGEPVDHTLFGGVPDARIIPPLDSGDTVSVHVYY